MARNNFNLRVGVTFHGEGAEQVKREFKRMSDSAQKSLSAVTSAANAVRFALVTLAGSMVVRQVLQTIATYEQLRGQLETIVGSAERASVAFAGIERLAASTPFSVEALTTAFVKLGALGIAPTEARLISYGNTAAAMGKDVTMFIEAVADAQVGEFERLKEFGIKARSEGDKVSFTFRGLTTTVGKNAKEIVEYLDRIGSTEFAGSMERQSMTLGGAWSNLQDTAASLMDRIGTGGLGRELSLLTRTMAETADGGEDLARRLGIGLGALVGAIQPLGGIVTGLITGILGGLGKLVEGFGRVTEWTAEKMAGFYDAIGLDGRAEKFRGLAEDARDATLVASEFAAINYDQMYDSWTSAGKQWDGLVDRLMAGAPTVDKSREGFDDVAGALDRIGGAASGASKGVEKAAAAHQKALDGLLSTYTPREAALQKLEKDERTLTAAISAGIGPIDQMTEALLALRSERAMLESQDPRKQQYIPTLELPEREMNFLGKSSAEVARNTERAQRYTDLLARDLKVATGETKTQAQLITEGLYQQVGRSLHDAASGFLVEMESGLVERLPKGMQSFAQALLSAANEWLIAMLANIVKAKLAAKGIGSADGGSGSGTNWLGTIAKFFKGGSGGSGASGAGTGSAAAGAGGIIIAAAAVAAILYKRNRDAQARFDQRRDTSATLSGGMATATGRFAAGTGAQAAQAMQDLFTALAGAARGGLDTLAKARVDIANGKKYFDAYIGDALVGRFTSMDAAIIAAVGGAFARSGAKLDEVVKSAIGSFSGKSVDDLIAAVQKMGEVASAFSGDSQLDQSITAVATSARALTSELISLGVNGFDAAVTGARSAVVGFRGAWQALSGKEMGAGDRRAQAEQSRALLLAEMKLEREKLAVDIKILQSKANLNRAAIDLESARLHGETLIVQMRGKQWGDELSLAQQYLSGRQQFVEGEAGLFDAQLQAMGVVLQELDKLIAEVSVGKINIGGVGKGLGKAADDFGKHVRTFGGAASRIKDYLESIRQLQARLVMGDASPYTGRQRVDIAKSEVDRLMAMYAQGGKSRTKALEEIGSGGQIEQYLDLFKQTFGSTGAYAGQFAQINDFLSTVLREHGIAPVANIAQASADAAAFAAKFKYDGRGKMHTRNEETEAELKVVAQRGLETRNNTARVADLLEILIAQNAQGGGGSRAANNVPGGPAPSHARRGGRYAGARG